SAASAASNASRLACARCSTTRVGIPRDSAKASPWASARLLRTPLTGRPASTSARRLLPLPEMRTTSTSVHPLRPVAVLLGKRDHALAAVEVQRAQGDERPAAAQLALHAERHHDAAVVQDALGHDRVVCRDLRVALGEALA